MAVTSSHSGSLSPTSHALQLFDLRNKFIAASLPLAEASLSSTAGLESASTQAGGKLVLGNANLLFL